MVRESIVCDAEVRRAFYHITEESQEMTQHILTNTIHSSLLFDLVVASRSNLKKTDKKLHSGDSVRPKLESAFRQELHQAKISYLSGDLTQCFYHLERAHILGQRDYLPHLTAHYWMLKVGLVRRDWREVFGQMIRLIGSIGSLIGWVPIGNTGRANVSALRPMAVPKDLEAYFREG